MVASEEGLGGWWQQGTEATDGDWRRLRKGVPAEALGDVRPSAPGPGLEQRRSWGPDSWSSGLYPGLHVITRSPRGRCWPRGHGTRRARLSGSADENLAHPRQQGARGRTESEPTNDFTNKS